LLTALSFGRSASVPELPEVETTRRGVEPLIKGQVVAGVVIRNHSFRLPVDQLLPKILIGQRLQCIERRAKYLFFEFTSGCLIWHLGMSGSMRVNTCEATAGPHDHVDLIFANGQCLRYRDPRRFGLVAWTETDPHQHQLIKHLGPEPWEDSFSGNYLHRLARTRKLAIKNFIMDGKIVVGVGNIYANESLHIAGIDPRRAASRVSLARYNKLVVAIRDVLDQAIAKGGTTLKDFVNSDGQPGYFRHELAVYDRKDEPCPSCGKKIKQVVIGQRSTFYCPNCQI
ncbi:MAG: bifunctional DNA-formamidopyrimidine glycosylase/DNA-(apurinic or apyrimidinic site) lyase, partial [Gammaproteobacteria bacterium]